VSSASVQPAPPPIRLVFKLERAEHPRLYDELVGFRKGAKRVNRLRVLAYDGLLAQQGLLVPDGGPRVMRPRMDDPQEGSPQVTNDLFAPALGG